MKPSLPQGTRDFNAATVSKRNYIFSVIKKTFELYGFQPLETPAIENLETLLGKYGDEGDKLIYRILDSGNPFSSEFIFKIINYIKDFETEIREINSLFHQNLSVFDSIVKEPKILSSLVKNLYSDPGLNKKYLNDFKSSISEKALRYDLTIPFARYVAMNYGQLSFPFKRYQIQPVWRADRPQKGRYREFYQCDADVVGSNSLLNEVELANIYVDVFKALNINVDIRINSRKILLALAETCGGADKIVDITIAIDKLDKIGIEKVKDELQQRGLNIEQIQTIEKYLSVTGSNNEKINVLKILLGENANAQNGIEEIEYVLNYNTSNKNITADFTLARGLNYYTGLIFEVKARNVSIGSIGGGGRYDDLTGLFGVPNLSGVGISFGVDRIYDVMEELQLFPATILEGTKVLFFNLGEEESQTAYDLMQSLRQKNISCEIYTETAKLGKQFQYAERKKIAYAVIIGTKEMQEQTCTIKNLTSGKQQTIAQSQFAAYKW